MTDNRTSPMRAMADPLDLDGIEARANAATPGPWHVDGPFWVDPPGVTPTEMTVETRAGVSGADRALVMEGTWESKDADAAHIAGMDPATTLALVAEVRALRAEVQQWRGWTQDALDRADSARAVVANVRMLRDRWSYLTTAMALPNDREFLESAVASLDGALSVAEPADQPSEAGA